MNRHQTRAVPVEQATPRHFERSVKLVTAALIGGVFLIAGLGAFAHSRSLPPPSGQTPAGHTAGT
jgi:hypothetical protein